MRSTTESPTLPARYIALLVDVLESTGVECTPLLRRARIRAIDIPGAQVTLPQVESLFEAAELASGRLDLGFELGHRLDPTSHDVLGFALLTSPTLGHLMRLAVTYQRLMQRFFSLSLQRTSGRVELVYLPAVALSHRAMRVLEEAIVVSNHSGFASTLGTRIPPYEVWMSIERPPHVQRYREIAPARVHFGDTVPGIRISIPADALDMPLAMANPRAMRAAEERCRALLRQTQVRRRWSEWCRTMLRESEDSRPTLETTGGVHEHLAADACALPRGGRRELPRSVARSAHGARPADARGERPVGYPDRLPARLHRRRELRAQLQRAVRAHPG